MRRLFTRIVIIFVAVLTVHVRADAATIGFFEWVDCSGAPPDGYEIECDLATTIFRITNDSEFLAGTPGFPALATPFSDITVSINGADSGDGSFSALPGAPASIYSVANPVADDVVTLSLNLDSTWVGTLTLPQLTAPNGELGLIEFEPSATVADPASATSVLLAVAAFAWGRRKLR